MQLGRFTGDRIIGELRGHEAGVKTAGLCRKHGIGAATFDDGKVRYGGMTVSEAARLSRFADGTMPSASGCARSPTSVADSPTNGWRSC